MAINAAVSIACSELQFQAKMGDRWAFDQLDEDERRWFVRNGEKPMGKEVAVVTTIGARSRQILLDDPPFYESLRGKWASFVPPSYERIVVGFPLHSFEGERWVRSDTWLSQHSLEPRITTSNLVVIERDGMIPYHMHFIPTGIIAHGFVLNSVVYGVLGWAVVLVVRSAIRREHDRRNIERGFCPSCAYDLRGAAHAVCPECGDAVTGKQAAS